MLQNPDTMYKAQITFEIQVPNSHINWDEFDISTPTWLKLKSLNEPII